MSNTILMLLDSSVVSTVIISVVVYLLNRLYTKKPLWKKYEGTVIAAIKFAEKHIPDGTDNKGLKRLDHALKYVIDIIESAEKRMLSSKEKLVIAEGIQIKHNEIEG